MKLFHLSVLYKTPGKSICLSQSSDVSSFGFFQRGTVAEFMDFTSGVLVERAVTGSRSCVKQEQYNCFVFVRHDKLSGVLVTDMEYPQRVAFTLLLKILEEFCAIVPQNNWPSMKEKSMPTFDKKLAEYLAKYQDPKQADSMTRLEADLDETKVILYDTIEKMLDRGEKLDDLVAKSDNLSDASKMFYKSARKTNQCCTYW